MLTFYLIAHFDRERIPERVVHAKGAGAHGVFGMFHLLYNLPFWTICLHSDIRGDS